jgi:hypothetical protein
MKQVHANLFANRGENENTEEKSKESWDSSRKSIDTNERETYCSQEDDHAGTWAGGDRDGKSLAFSCQ